MPGLHVLDRIGSGDAFAAGLVHALAYGTAHGALVMTTPGDVSMATLTEVESLIAGGSAHLRRRRAPIDIHQEDVMQLSKTMKALVAEREWLTVVLLPGYAPELNPVEAL